MWLVIEQITKEDFSVWLTNDKPAADHHKGFRFWRVSELHAVDKAAFRTPGDADFYLGFVVHPSAYEAVGSLTEPELNHVLYGPGLASIVICAQEKRAITDILAKWASEYRAYELWTISNKTIKNRERYLCDPEQIDSSEYILPNYDIRNADASWIIWELSLNLSRFIDLSCQYAPSNLDKCQNWVRSLRVFIEELRYFDAIENNEIIAKPTFISEELDQRLKTDRFFRKQKTNYDMDRLIQVNSSLVYATSQAFYGAVPIELSLPLTSPHSLLGIGTAWFALRNLCSFIEEIFERYSVPKIMDEQFHILPWQDYETINSNTTRFDYSKDALATNSFDKVRPKISYYSSRLGFGESDFSVTCAMQTLHAASSSRYTLMTLSHEMLHAHVKMLLDTIFIVKGEDNLPLPAQEALKICFDRYRLYSNKQPPPDLKLIDTIRFTIIEFVIEYRKYSEQVNSLQGLTGQNEQHLIQIGITLPSTTDAWERALRVCYRFLEEIFVHTLDLHYFYAADVQAYVDGLWTSWEHIPSVSDKLERYMLRTLVAIATIEVGEVCVRFDKAMKIMEDRLIQLSERNKECGVINRVLILLKNDKIQKWLLYMFIPSVRIADLVAKYLMDARIGRALRIEDEWTHRGDERIMHRLPEMTFQDKSVGNPILFVYEKLIHALEQDLSTTSTEEELARTTWMFLAMSNYAVTVAPPQNPPN